MLLATLGAAGVGLGAAAVAVRDSLRNLRASRARIISGADRERQRIERDLHDGAQQSLVALRIRLELAVQLLEENPAHARQLMSQLATEVDETLDEVRDLARGVYPHLLADRGLGGALQATAWRSPVPVSYTHLTLPTIYSV